HFVLVQSVFVSVQVSNSQRCLGLRMATLAGVSRLVRRTVVREERRSNRRGGESGSESVFELETDGMKMTRATLNDVACDARSSQPACLPATALTLALIAPFAAIGQAEACTVNGSPS